MKFKLKIWLLIIMLGIRIRLSTIFGIRIWNLGRCGIFKIRLLTILSICIHHLTILSIGIRYLNILSIGILHCNILSIGILYCNILSICIRHLTILSIGIRQLNKIRIRNTAWIATAVFIPRSVAGQEFTVLLFQIQGCSQGVILTLFSSTQ